MEAFSICQRLGDFHYLALCRYGLAITLARQGQSTKAMPLYQESLRAAVNEGNHVLAMSVIIGIAQLMQMNDDSLQAYILATGVARVVSAQNLLLEKIAQVMLEAVLTLTTGSLSSLQIAEAQSSLPQLTAADLYAAASNVNLR